MTFQLAYEEINALVALTSAGCQTIERSAGRNNAAWTLVNSLRTLFAEAAVLRDPSASASALVEMIVAQHPCRGCEQMPDEHPNDRCQAWY